MVFAVVMYGCESVKVPQKCPTFYDPMDDTVHGVARVGHDLATKEKEIQTFVSKVMSLLFNMLSRFVIAFLPRSTLFYFHGCSHHLQ